MGSVSFKGGLEAEDRIRTKLKTYGCELQSDEKLNHQQKLDFVLLRLPENPTYRSIGVQVTTNIDNAAKMDEFFQINKNCRVARDGCLYLELEKGVDLEDGGGLAVLMLIGEFTLNRKMQQTKIVGARIFADLTYEFYNIEERIKELRQAEVTQRMAAAAAAVTIQTPAPAPVQVATVPVVSTPTPPALAPAVAKVTAVSAAARINAALHNDGRMGGVLSTYFRQSGHGFIVGQTGEQFFFHRSRISQELKRKLDSLPEWGGEDGRGAYRNLGYEVRFKDMGINKPGAQYPEAQQVEASAIN